jgi:hypothetical protein
MATQVPQLLFLPQPATGLASAVDSPVSFGNFCFIVNTGPNRSLSLSTRSSTSSPVNVSSSGLAFLRHFSTSLHSTGFDIRTCFPTISTTVSFFAILSTMHRVSFSFSPILWNCAYLQNSNKHHSLKLHPTSGAYAQRKAVAHQQLGPSDLPSGTGAALP